MSMINQFDPSTHDGIVILAADHRRGIYTSQVATKAALKAVRTAGTLPTAASAHTLLSVALCNALRNVSKSQCLKMTVTRPTGSLPRILVVSDDMTYLDALVAFRDGIAGPRLKAGKNFHDLIRSQLSRFDLTFKTDVDNIANSMVRDWATKHIIAPALLSGFPTALLPSAISFAV